MITVLRVVASKQKAKGIRAIVAQLKNMYSVLGLDGLKAAETQANR